jgi:hypothetical protein
MSQDQKATAFHFFMVNVTAPFLVSPEDEEEEELSLPVVLPSDMLEWRVAEETCINVDVY